MITVQPEDVVRGLRTVIARRRGPNWLCWSNISESSFVSRELLCIYREVLPNMYRAVRLARCTEEIRKPAYRPISRIRRSKRSEQYYKRVLSALLYTQLFRRKGQTGDKSPSWFRSNVHCCANWMLVKLKPSFFDSLLTKWISISRWSWDAIFEHRFRCNFPPNKRLDWFLCTESRELR